MKKPCLFWWPPLLHWQITLPLSIRRPERHSMSKKKSQQFRLVSVPLAFLCYVLWKLCFHTCWLLCLKFQLSGTGIYNSPLLPVFRVTWQLIILESIILLDESIFLKFPEQYSHILDHFSFFQNILLWLPMPLRHNPVIQRKFSFTATVLWCCTAAK